MTIAATNFPTRELRKGHGPGAFTGNFYEERSRHHGNEGSLIEMVIETRLALTIMNLLRIIAYTITSVLYLLRCFAQVYDPGRIINERHRQTRIFSPNITGIVHRSKNTVMMTIMNDLIKYRIGMNACEEINFIDKDAIYEMVGGTKVNLLKN